MILPIHELAALGTALSWALSGLIAAEAVRAMGPFHFNLLRQIFVALLLGATVSATGAWQGIATGTLALLALSGVIGILMGDTLNFAGVARLGPRRGGAVFALNAPMAAVLGWLLLDESLPLQAWAGIALAALGVALAVLGRPRQDAHALETLRGAMVLGVLFGLGGALGQAAGSLIARPMMEAGMDPYLASMARVGASGLAMAVLAATPLAPAAPRAVPRRIVLMALATAILGLVIGMTLFLFALRGAETGIVATLSASSPVLILPMLWLRTGQRPTGQSWLGAVIALAGMALIFTR